MGGYKDIQNQGEELAADPVFKIAVLDILEKVLDPLLRAQIETNKERFVMRDEIKKRALK